MSRELAETIIRKVSLLAVGVLMLSVFSSVSVGATTASPTISYETQISGLTQPGGVAVSSVSDRIYITDSSSCDVKIYDMNYQLLSEFGSCGSGDGQFMNPLGIAIDSTGNVYVNDDNLHRIEKFTADGTYISQFGTHGAGNGQLDYPGGMAFDSDGNLLVADGINGRVQKFSPDGTYISQFGTKGTGAGQLSYVEALAINSNGDVYVTDGNNNVQKYDASGTHIAQIDGTGTSAGPIGYAEGLAIDDKDNVYIFDYNNDTLYVYDSNNVYLGTAGVEDLVGGQIQGPYYAVYDSGKIYLVNNNASSLDVYLVHQPVALPDSTVAISGKALTGKPTIPQKPTFSGVAPAGSTIVVTAHSDPITCTTTADADGNWSCTLASSLAPGQHTVQVVVTTTTGQVLTLGPYTVYVSGTTILSPNTGVPPNTSSMWGIYVLVLSFVAVFFTLRSRLLLNKKG